MVGAFFVNGEICAFLCPFLRKEVSTVANRIMGITVEIGAILAIFPEWGQKVPPHKLELKKCGGKKCRQNAKVGAKSAVKTAK